MNHLFILFKIISTWYLWMVWERDQNNIFQYTQFSPHDFLNILFPMISMVLHHNQVPYMCGLFLMLHSFVHILSYCTFVKESIVGESLGFIFFSSKKFFWLIHALLLSMKSLDLAGQIAHTNKKILYWDLFENA